MARLLAPIRRGTGQQAQDRSETEVPEEPAAGGSRSRLVRALAATAAGAALVYVASRRAGSGDSAPSVDEIREHVGPGTAERDAGEAAAETSGGSASGVRQRDSIGPAGDGADASDGPADVDLGDAPSEDELEERAASDVRTEPAEPGEMAVDDDVVKNLVDETDDDG